jgi:nucleotide-binding universal stress UspA family protein
MTSALSPIVAGVDGSPSSLGAARYAAGLAARRAAPLDCVCAYLPPLYGYPPMGGVDPSVLVDERARKELDTMLAGVARGLREAYPELGEVIVRQVPGGAAAALIELSREASVTVVGSRGVGGFADLLLGSTSSQVAAHAHGPVVVVRPPVADDGKPGDVRPDEGPVLVGVDGSAEAAAALKFAAEEALSRRTPLVLLHAYWTALHPVTHDPDHEGVAAARKLLEEAADQVRHGWPELEVQTRDVHTTGVEQTMIDASREAGLTVVGCRGRGGFAGALLGSVSRALTHHAFGPVAVVHQHDLGRR